MLTNLCITFMWNSWIVHFKIVRARFYILKGVDDLNLKQAYLNQFLEPLGNETLKYLEFQGRLLVQSSLVDLY